MSRKNRDAPLPEFDPVKADRVLDQLRSGLTLAEAIEKARVPAPLVRRWLTHAERTGPEAEVYRPFAEAVNQIRATTPRR